MADTWGQEKAVRCLSAVDSQNSPLDSTLNHEEKGRGTRGSSCFPKFRKDSER